MKRPFVEVWDHRNTYSDGTNDARIGVNWSAVGPVLPNTARRFAERILKAADKAEKLRHELEVFGYELVNPEK